MPERNSDTLTASDRDLIIRRTFDAPRELVWKSWTEPERIKRWLAPKDFTIPVAEGDLRPGGAWREIMRKPDGTELSLGGVYREIVEPQRLVFTHAWLDNDGKPEPETLVTITFADRGSKTEMKFRQSGFDSVESREGHEGGWKECFDKLEKLLSQ